MTRYELLKLMCDGLTDTDNAPQLQKIITGIDNWEILIKEVSGQLLTPALYYSLSKKKLLEDIPNDVVEYFEVIYELSAEHNRVFFSEMFELGKQLNAAGVKPVLLKGAGSLWDDTYQDIGIRMMSDVDMLVSLEQYPACIKVFEELGYYTTANAKFWDDDEPHLPPYYHRNNRARFEVHHEVFSKRFQSILPAQDMLKQARLCTHDGVDFYLPSPTHRVLHNIVHSQLDDKGYKLRRVYFRQLYDQYVLHSHFAANIDWSEINTRMRVAGHERAFQYALQLESCFFAEDIAVDLSLDKVVARQVQFIPFWLNNWYYLKIRSFGLNFPSALSSTIRKIYNTLIYKDYRKRVWKRLFAWGR